MAKTTTPYYKIQVPQEIVDDVRMYIGDTPELNRLIRGVESSDQKIVLAIRMYIDHFNNTPPELVHEYGAEDFPSAKLLIEGAALELLRMAGIIQSRNFLNFNDAGAGFTVSDKAQDYQSWIQNILQTHREDAINVRVAQNAKEGWDFINSPEAWWPPYST
jgi:hypothetical protein